jgi:glycerol-3-phosphate acyltransferase PlsY
MADEPGAAVSVFTKFRQGIGARAASLGYTLLVTFIYAGIGCLVYMTTEPRVCSSYARAPTWP